MQFLFANTVSLSSLRSFLPCHYSLFRRQYEALYVIVREVLLTFALIQPTLDRFPHFVSYPPPTFSFVLVQSGSSKSFLHRPFNLLFAPLSPLIANLLETFSHSKFLSSPTPLTSPRCPFNLPSPAHLTLLFYPVQLLFSTFFAPSLTIEFLFPIRRTSPIFSYLYNPTNLSHHRFEPVL